MHRLSWVYKWHHGFWAWRETLGCILKFKLIRFSWSNIFQKFTIEPRPLCSTSLQYWMWSGQTLPNQRARLVRSIMSFFESCLLSKKLKVGQWNGNAPSGAFWNLGSSQTNSYFDAALGAKRAKSSFGLVKGCSTFQFNVVCAMVPKIEVPELQLHSHNCVKCWWWRMTWHLQDYLMLWQAVIFKLFEHIKLWVTPCTMNIWFPLRRQRFHYWHIHFNDLKWGVSKLSMSDYNWWKAFVALFGLRWNFFKG